MLSISYIFPRFWSVSFFPRCRSVTFPRLSITCAFPRFRSVIFSRAFDRWRFSRGFNQLHFPAFPSLAFSRAFDQLYFPALLIGDVFPVVSISYISPPFHHLRFSALSISCLSALKLCWDFSSDWVYNGMFRLRDWLCGYCNIHM